MSLFATQAITLSLLALAIPALSQPVFLNGFGESVDFHCPDGYALSSILSELVPDPGPAPTAPPAVTPPPPTPPPTGRRKRNTVTYDRLWSFGCTPVSLFLS